VYKRIASLWDLLLRAILRWAPTAEVAGITVAIPMRAGPARDRALTALREAIALLQTHDPTRLARIRREFGRVVLFDAGRRFQVGGFNPRLRICGINVGYLSERPSGAALIMVSVLAHEAMHGLLAHLGYGDKQAMDAPTLRRVERLCRKAEWAVLSRIPQPAAQRERLAEIYANEVPCFRSRS